MTRGRLVLSLALLAAVASPALAQEQRSPTFNRDVAPIIFQQCIDCHRAGGVAPFPLTKYQEVKKRAKQIAQVTVRHYMPPWLPEPAYGDFEGERRLSEEQIATLQRWWKAGAPEGRAGDLKAAPVWNDDWHLGKPDLIIAMPEPYTLSAEGGDVYRNFVIENVVATNRYIRAAEIRPGNLRVVHHVALLLDTTGSARLRAHAQHEPGFPGMHAGRGVSRPEGHLVTWQPGKRIMPEPAGTAWLLPAGADVILQMHLRPGGKPEKVQGEVGLYFAEQRPAREAFTALIRVADLSIPAGATDYPAESGYTLPVDVDLIGIFPHLHYLGKEVRAWAERPDGKREELLFIRQWDFNWQGDYHYRQPLFLPQGTKIRMRYTYDNSRGNIRNPNDPPKPVLYGPATSDEMSDLFLQMLPRHATDLALLRRDYFNKYALADNIEFSRAMLRHDPKDAESRTNLGAALAVTGKGDEAIVELAQAAADDPQLARPHYILSHIYLSRNDLQSAIKELGRTVELDPRDSNAEANLGTALLRAGDIARAITHFERALVLNPADTLAETNLKQAKAALQKK
jgi:mono/diheme cytochrome c family protein/thioredoxin-like negative regulator of GroEL